MVRESKKPRPYDLSFLLWQGCQFWNQTFDEDVEKVDIEEVHELLDKK